MPTEAVILAGGFGTRLQSVVTDVPKPMAPINGKPFLAYLLNYCIAQGLQRVVLSTGYKHDVIEKHFGTQYKSLQIAYAHESTPLGTGGGIQNALKHCHSSNVVVLNGDSFFEVDLTQFEAQHRAGKSEFSIAAKKMYDFDRYGILQTKDSRITAFEEKRAVHEGLINAGVYLIDKDKFLAHGFPEKFSMEKDFMEKYFSTHHFHAFEFDAYFIDIGIPEDFEKVQKDFATKF